MGGTDLQSVSISGLSVEIHTTGKASRVLAMKMTSQAVCMHISRICTSLLGLGLGCGGNYFYSEVRYRFSSGSNY